MAETVMASSETPTEAKKGFPWLKLLVLAVVVVGLILLFKKLPMAQWIEQFKAYVQAQGALGYLIFGLAYVGASLIPGGPAALLTAAAGAIWGVVTGTAVVSVSSVTAATLAFILARTVFRKRVEKMTEGNVKFKSLNKAIEKNEAKMVALVRLSPVFPFTFINYAFGLTPVKTATYVLTSWIAMLPGTAAYVYLGYAAAQAAGGASAEKKIINVVVAVVAVVATALVARIAAKAIKDAGVEEAPAAT